MARDNSPKERQKKQLERKQGRRASYDRILIVSEGSKTEPNYFQEIRAAYRLHTANVEVRSSELGTAPIQVVQYAQTLFENGDRHKNIQRRVFEKVYAVFDRDDHDSYHDALALAASLDGNIQNDARQLTMQQIARDTNTKGGHDSAKSLAASVVVEWVKFISTSSQPILAKCASRPEGQQGRTVMRSDPLAGFATEAVCNALGLEKGANQDAVSDALQGITPEQVVALRKADQDSDTPHG